MSRLIITDTKKRPEIIKQGAKGWLVPSLAAANAATYSQTGTTITVTSILHNIPAATFDGEDVYLAIASGAAVAGWFSNFTRVDANTFTCESTISQTTSGSVNTNLSVTTITEATATILANSMGLNGNLEINTLWSWFSSADIKRPKITFGGNQITAFTPTTSVMGRWKSLINNRNSTTKKICPSTNNVQSIVELSSATQENVNFSLNTALNQDIAFLGSCDAASNYISLRSFNIILNPS